MPIDSSVAELITAQFFVLSQEAPDPIYFYINSTGIAVREGLRWCGSVAPCGGLRWCWCLCVVFVRVHMCVCVVGRLSRWRQGQSCPNRPLLQRLLTTTPTPAKQTNDPTTQTQKSTTKYGNEHEAIAVYSMMRAVQKFCPIYTLCVGNAFGEAALLLAAGTKGKRAALRSATVMIRQPLQRLAGMQASDIDIYRRVTREKTALMVRRRRRFAFACFCAFCALRFAMLLISRRRG